MAGGKIFVCYRRDDSSGHAGRLYDRLNQRFPGRVFMDVTGIGVGTRWAEVIESTLGSCRVAIVLIGKRWLEPGAGGLPRLHVEDDPTRAEIRAALRLKLSVVPLLVSGAAVPDRSQLPDDIAALTDWQALRVDDDDFDHDAMRLVRALETQLGDTPLSDADGTEQPDGHDLRHLMTDAESAIARGDWVTAAQTLQSVLALDKHHQAARSRLEFVQDQWRQTFTAPPARRQRVPRWAKLGAAAFAALVLLGWLIDAAQVQQQTNGTVAPIASGLQGDPAPVSGRAPATEPSSRTPPADTRPVSPTVRTSEPQPAASAAVPPPPPAAAPTMQGDYVLIGYRERGVPGTLSGALRLTQINDATFQFEMALSNPILGITYQYRGISQGSGAQWVTTATQTNDVNLLNVPVQSQATFDGTTLSLLNSFGQEFVWRKR